MKGFRSISVYHCTSALAISQSRKSSALNDVPPEYSVWEDHLPSVFKPFRNFLPVLLIGFLLSLTEAHALESNSHDRALRAESAAAFAMGHHAEAEGRTKDAIRYYQEVVEYDPTYLDAIILLARTLFKDKQYENALTHLQSSLTHHPESADVHSLVAFAYIKTNKLSDAIAHSKLALQKDPTQIDNYRILVSALDQQGKHSEIDQLFTQSVATESKDAIHYIRLGEMWLNILKSKNYNLPTKEEMLKVIPLYERAHQLDPKNPMIAFRVGEIAYRALDYPKAAIYLRKAYLINPGLPKLSEQFALSLLNTGQEKEALEVLENLMETRPQSKEFYPLLAELYKETNQLTKAEQYYQLTNSIGHPTPQSFIELALIQFELKKLPDAIKTLKKGTNIFPDIPQFHLLKGRIFMAEKNYPHAQSSYDSFEKLALRVNPKLLDSKFYLAFASTYERHKNFNQAETLLKKAIDLNPDDHEAMNYLAYMWAEQGIKLKQAKILLLKALSYELENPAYLDSLAWTYYQMGNYEEALSYMQQAIKGMPDDPVVNHHLGDVFIKLGKHQEAQTAWEKALANADKDSKSEIAKKLDLLKSKDHTTSTNSSSDLLPQP